MQLNIVSKEFFFHSGVALLSPEGPQHASYPADFVERMELVRSREFVLENGSIGVSNKVDAGEFKLWLGDLKVSRITEPETVMGVPFYIHMLAIAEQDIAAGIVQVTVAPEGIYRITLRSPSGQLLPRQPLTFNLDLFSITVNSGEDGAIICLGNPFYFFVPITDFSMTIAPV